MEREIIEIGVKVKGIEEAQKKADELLKTLEKAKTLIAELASTEINITEVTEKVTSNNLKAVEVDVMQEARNLAVTLMYRGDKSPEMIRAIAELLRVTC